MSSTLIINLQSFIERLMKVEYTNSIQIVQAFRRVYMAGCVHFAMYCSTGNHHYININNWNQIYNKSCVKIDLLTEQKVLTVRINTLLHAWYCPTAIIDRRTISDGANSIRCVGWRLVQQFSLNVFVADGTIGVHSELCYRTCPSGCLIRCSFSLTSKCRSVMPYCHCHRRCY